MLLRTTIPLAFLVTAYAFLLGACGSQQPLPPTGTLDNTAAAWPEALPADVLQPWEELNAQGYVAPPERDYFGDKATSAVNVLSEFVPGVEYETAAGDATPLGEGLRLLSGGAGSGALSYAVYRVTLGGVQPGVVSADVNLRPRGDNTPSKYWLGLSDYGAGSWQWHGPFGDNHVRLGTTEPGTDYLSPLGNLFVCVAAFDGAAVDVVGIGANPRDAADTTPPPPVTVLIATPYAGALMLQWIRVGAADLAGYKVYWAKQSFTSPAQWYVQCEPYLEGADWHLLTTSPQRTYMCVSAVDITGNESLPSEVVSAVPLPEEPPVLQLTTDTLSGPRATQVTLTATGAELYIWDLNGDGQFDVIGDTTGIGTYQYDAPGLWRPMVKGVSSDGTKAACAAVSLIITGNIRPVASATATPQSGTVPLSVTFIGIAEDEEDDPPALTYAWDFDGDGTYEPDTDTLTPVLQEYSVVGLYNAKFRVEDSEGGWDVDTVAVQALANEVPCAHVAASPCVGDAPLEVTFNAIASYDLDGSIVDYAWDWSSDGSWDDSGASPTATHTYQSPWNHIATVQVTDDDGATSEAAVGILVRGARLRTADTSGDVGDKNTSICVVNGNPAIAYFDGTNQNLMYVRADDENGASWGTPVTVDGNATDDVGWYSDLQVVNGQPAIAYYDHTSGELLYSRSGDANGTFWGLVMTADAGAGNDVGTYLSMAIINGRPAISYGDYSASDLKYVRASDENGLTWGTPQTPDGSGLGCIYTSLADVNGRPAIAYYRVNSTDLRYIRANDQDGTSWPGVPVIVDSPSVGTHASMAIVAGRPAISYYHTTDYELRYVRGADANGQNWMNPQVLDTDDYFLTGWYASLAVIDEQPAISYQDYTNKDLRYIRANDRYGSDWGLPLVADYGGDVGEFTSLTEVNGRAGIAYRDEVSGNLKYAMIVE